MKKLYGLTILIAVLALFGAAAAQAGKQPICHFPPGNEANFHTIWVSDSAVAKHVEKHLDLEGTCLENCEIICDDEDFCTQDVESDPDQCICLAEPRPEVNCDDSNPCTADSCSSAVGACVYDTAILNGEPCDDGDPDTDDDVCTDGVCAGTSGPDCPCLVDTTFRDVVFQFQQGNGGQCFIESPVAWLQYLRDVAFTDGSQCGSVFTGPPFPGCTPSPVDPEGCITSSRPVTPDENALCIEVLEQAAAGTSGCDF